MARCGDCLHRFEGACSFSVDKENPARPNYDEPCIHSPSKFAKKEIRHGRVVSPMQEPNPAPMNAEIRSPTPEPSGYSLASWASPDGLGSISFLTKDGKVYHPETLEPMGLLSDYQQSKPSEAQLEESVRWLKERFKTT